MKAHEWFYILSRNLLSMWHRAREEIIKSSIKLRRPKKLCDPLKKLSLTLAENEIKEINSGNREKGEKNTGQKRWKPNNVEIIKA